MRILRPRALAAVVLLVLGTVVFLPYICLKRGIAAPDFKHFAEEKAGEFLKAKVEIGKIRVRFPNRVVLSDLKLSRPDSSEGPSRLQIGQLIFRYHFFQLFSRHLPNPSGVTLRAPKVMLSDSGLPYSFFKNFDFHQTQSGVEEVIHLEFAGGEIRTPIPGLDAELLLTDIRGKISPQGNGKLNVDLRSSVQGAAAGKVRIQGEVDPLHQAHHLLLELDSVSGNWGGPLSGKIRCV